MGAVLRLKRIYLSIHSLLVEPLVFQSVPERARSVDSDLNHSDRRVEAHLRLTPGLAAGHW